MEKIRRPYNSDEVRLEAVREYYETGVSQNFIARKYNLRSPSTFRNWLKRFPITDESLSLSDSTITSVMKKQVPVLSQDEKQKRICDLEKALAHEKLRSEALSTMIDIAEKQEGICIRKKPGAKQ
ncbi:MAG TPA: transposase [Bacteroides reticulotermitis]|nr:transposase [Bacteroides reticulotermitis]